MSPFNYMSACFILLVAGLGAAGWLWFKRRMRSEGSRLPVTAEWIEELSAECYQPMTRLLGGDDLAFLKTDARCTARHVAEFRKRRAQVFRAYLQCLHNDFQRISMAIRILMVQSRDDRADLAGLLLCRRVRYAVAAVTVQVQLLLYRWGICEVDTKGLVRTFEAMRLDLRALRYRTVPTQV